MAQKAETIPLIDSRIVAQAFAMRREVMAPVEAIERPILTDCQAYGSVLRESDGLWRMWYLGEPVYCEYYATSSDGLTWERPELDLVSPEVRGDLTGANAIMCRYQCDANGRCLVGGSGPEGFCVLDAELTPHPAAKRRFTTMYLAGVHGPGGPVSGMCVAHSDDGIHWVADEHNPVIREWRDTSSVVLFDTRIGKYVWYGRPAAYASPATHANRLLARSESDDLVHWTPDQTILDTDELDADAFELLDEAALRSGTETASAKERADAWAALTEGAVTESEMPLVRGRNRQWYGITVFPYADLYLGLAWMYDLPTGEMWTELIHSYDGIDWRREAIRRPFFPRTPGTCCCTMASPPVAVGDELRLYDSIMARNHHGVPAPNVEPGIRVWSVRRDRWVAYSADRHRGELLTQVMPRPSHLTLNAAIARDGSVRVEVTDAHGKALPGLGLAESQPLTGDDLALVPTWSSGTRVVEAAEEQIRLRVVARHAQLFGIGGMT